MPSSGPTALLAQLLRTIVLAALCASLAQAQESLTSGNRNLNVASATKRVALVIGNAAYPGPGALKNPANDAQDIGAKLKHLGFEVILRTDLKQKDMLRALTEFGGMVSPGTEALFFYAGHGMQVRGKNYLVPVDAEIRQEADVSSEAVDVDQLLDKLAPARLSMVILDACRNNPFERRFRGGGQGLAQINAPTGTLIAYATAPGKVAADGEGRNGLYTSELLTAMDVPGIKIEDVFKRVRANVVRKSGEAQTPWESSSLTGDFYFQSGQGAQVAQLGPGIGGASRSAEQIEDELWDAIKNSDKERVFEEYLKQYPKGRYQPQARVKLAGLKSDAKPAPSPSTAAPAASNDADTALWRAVEQGNSADDYDVYVKQYPKGKYAALAKQRAQKLKEEAAQRTEAAEQSAWRSAEGNQTATGYASYLARYPNGKFAALAQTRANKLNREAAERATQEAARMQKAQEEAAQRDAERARQEAARVADEQRKAREEAARGPQWADADNDYDINWHEATQYCASKGSGWRLPTSTELQSGYRSGQSTPCGKRSCKFTSNSLLTGPWFWTKERNGSSMAWYVYLDDGSRNPDYVETKHYGRALCVRGP